MIGKLTGYGDAAAAAAEVKKIINLSIDMKTNVVQHVEIE